MESPSTGGKARANQEEEIDFEIVKTAIESLTDKIVTILYQELGSVLDQAKSISLIGPDMYGQYKDGKDNKAGAREYLEVAMGQCSMDHSKVKDFLEIFEKIRSLGIISITVREEIRKLEKEKVEKMRKLEKEKVEASVTTTSDAFVSPKQCHTPRQLSEQSSTHSLKSVKSVDSATQGIQEQSYQNPKEVTFRSFPNIQESTQESDLSGTVSLAEPQEVFAKGRQTFKNVTDKAQMQIQSMKYTYHQVKEALPLGDPTQKEVSEKLDKGMQVTGKYYGTYMTIAQTKQSEIDELEKRYDREFQELKKKHEAMAEEESRFEQEKEENDLKSKYSKDAMKFAEDGKLLEDQVNFQSETSSVELLQVKIEYEKKINELSNKLNHEIHSLKDEIASLKDENTALKLREKEKEKEALQMKLDKAERKLQKRKDERT